MAKTETALALQATDFKAVELIGNNPAALTDMIRENIGSELSSFDLPRLKVPSGGASFWEVMTAEGPKPMEAVEGVILFRKDGKKFWEKSQDESGGENTPPDCASDDRIFGHGVPGGECNKCPYNEFNTAKKGTGKACRDFAELYILRKDSVMPMVVQVPATSLKKLKEYGIILMDSVKGLSSVLTRFTLTAEMKGGSKTAIINFKVAEDIPADMKAFVQGYRASLESLISAQTARGPVVATTMPEEADAGVPENDGPAPFSS